MMGKLQLAGRIRGAIRAVAPVGLNIAQRHGPAFPTLQHNGLIARCFRDWPDDSRFLTHWNQLLAKNSWATAFRSPAWQSAVVDEFVPAGQFRLLTVRKGAELLALVPLAFNTAAMLETPGKWVTDYLDPLVDSAHAAECWPLILEMLDKLWDWSVRGVVLHHIREESVVRKILPPIAAEFGFEYQEELSEKAPYIQLPKTWELYLASLSSSERQHLKKKMRAAQKKGQATLVKHTDIQDATPALDRAIAAMCQAASTRKADFTAEVLSGFMKRLFPQLARQGDFTVYELLIKSEPAAWLLALKSDKGPMLYNTGYSYAHRQWSPGIVSFAMAIQDSIAQGHEWFNFLRGGEEYKKKLGGTDLNLYRVTLKRSRR